VTERNRARWEKCISVVCILILESVFDRISLYGIEMPSLGLYVGKLRLDGRKVSLCYECRFQRLCEILGAHTIWRFVLMISYAVL
jgi:hypothetical protein